MQQEHSPSHPFSIRPPVVQQPATTVSADFFFIFFLFGLHIKNFSQKLTSPQSSFNRGCQSGFPQWETKANTAKQTNQLNVKSDKNNNE